MNCKVFYIILFMAVALGIVRADTRVSNNYSMNLCTVFEQLKQENLQILFNRAAVQEALVTTLARKTDFLPEFSANAQQTRLRSVVNFGTGPISFQTNSFDAGIAGVFSLVDASKWGHYRLAKMGYKIAEKRYRAIVESILLQAGLLFLEHERNVEVLSVLEAQIKADELLLEQTKIRHQNLAASPLDVKRAEVALADTRKQQLDQRLAVEKSATALARLLGFSKESGYTIGLEKTPLCAVSGGLQVALQNRPDYQAELESGNQKNLESQAALWDLWPQVTASGAYGSTGEKAFSGKHSKEWSVGVNVSVPLSRLVGFQVNEKRRKALVQGRAQGHLIEDMENEIAAALTLSAMTLEKRKEQIEIAQLKLDLGKEEIALARERFSNGVADNRDWVDAQARLVEHEDALSAARYYNDVALLERAYLLGDIMQVCSGSNV